MDLSPCCQRWAHCEIILVRRPCDETPLLLCRACFLRGSSSVVWETRVARAKGRFVEQGSELESGTYVHCLKMDQSKSTTKHSKTQHSEAPRFAPMRIVTLTPVLVS